MRKIWLMILSLGIIVALLVGCGANQDLPQISIHEVEENPMVNNRYEQEEPLKVAVSAIISAKETIIYYEDLINYLGQALNRPIEIVQRKTYGEINDLLRVGQVDLAFICTYAYTLGNDEFGMELLVAPEVNGKATYQNYMIVPAGSKAETLEDLKGKRFAFTDPISFTGRMYAVYRLQKMGYTPEEFFQKVIYTYSHDNSIKAVAQNLVDGAAVDGLILEYLYITDPSYRDKIKIIHKSEEFGIPPVTVPPGIDPELKQQLQEIFTTLHEKEANKELLDSLQIDKFVIPRDEDYDAIREVVNTVIYNEK